MVDFQSRDTNRGLDEAEEPDDGGEPSGTDGEGETADGAESSTESESDDDPPTSDGTEDSGTAPVATGTDDDGHDHGGHDHGDHDGHDHDGSHPHHDHGVETASVAVVTVSSTRSLAEDAAGDAIVEGLEAAGHEVVGRELLPDDFDTLQESLVTLVDHPSVDAVVTTGGTGVTPDDVTVEAAKPLFDKELPGFGELFRLLSYDDVGTRVVATRATAGIVETVPVFCLPGSEAAARLGTEDVVAEELGHVVALARRE